MKIVFLKTSQVHQMALNYYKVKRYPIFQSLSFQIFECEKNHNTHNFINKKNYSCIFISITGIKIQERFEHLQMRIGVGIFGRNIRSLDNLKEG